MNNLDNVVAENPDLYRGLYRLGEPRRTNKIEFAVETIATTRRDIEPLFERHYQEIAQFKHAQKLDPDWEAYERIEQSGKLWIMTARDQGNLVGYMVMFVAHDMHYRQLKRATEDIHFVLPEYRQGLLGYRLIRKTIEAMKNLGVGMIKFRTKASNSHAVLFERLGGELEDLVYTFVL